MCDLFVFQSARTILISHRYPLPWSFFSAMYINTVLVVLVAVLSVQISAARFNLFQFHQAALPQAADVGLEAQTARHLLQMSSCPSGCSNVLKSATNFGALAYSMVTSTGNTIIQGAIGVHPETATTGFPPGVATEGQHLNDSSASVAQTDAHIGAAYLVSLTPTTDLSGKDLVGLTLYPGVYYFSAGAQLSGKLILDGLGNSSALFVFQTVSTFVTAAGSEIALVNGTQPCNVYFAPGSSGTLGTNSIFMGNMVAQTKIALESGVKVNGSLISLTGAVTMKTVFITAVGDCTAA